MALVEIMPPVNQCRWATATNKDGSQHRLKAKECHSVSCRYSKDFGKSSCRCL